MKDRYQIRRKDNNLYYFTRNNMNDARQIKADIEKASGVEHYIYDTKAKAIKH